MTSCPLYRLCTNIATSFDGHNITSYTNFVQILYKFCTNFVDQSLIGTYLYIHYLYLTSNLLDLIKMCCKLVCVSVSVPGTYRNTLWNVYIWLGCFGCSHICDMVVDIHVFLLDSKKICGIISSSLPRSYLLTLINFKTITFNDIYFIVNYRWNGICLYGYCLQWMVTSSKNTITRVQEYIIKRIYILFEQILFCYLAPTIFLIYNNKWTMALRYIL